MPFRRKTTVASSRRFAQIGDRESREQRGTRNQIRKETQRLTVTQWREKIKASGGRRWRPWPWPRRPTPITKVVAFYGVRAHKCNGVRTQAPRFALQRSGYRCVVHKLLTVDILQESRVSVCFSISIFVSFFPSFRIFLLRLWHCYRPRDHHGYLTYRASWITNVENTSFPRHDLNQLRESILRRRRYFVWIFKRCFAKRFRSPETLESVGRGRIEVTRTSTSKVLHFHTHVKLKAVARRLLSRVDVAKTWLPFDDISSRSSEPRPYPFLPVNPLRLRSAIYGTRYSILPINRIRRKLIAKSTPSPDFSGIAKPDSPIWFRVGRVLLLKETAKDRRRKITVKL